MTTQPPPAANLRRPPGVEAVPVRGFSPDAEHRRRRPRGQAGRRQEAAGRPAGGPAVRGAEPGGGRGIAAGGVRLPGGQPRPARPDGQACRGRPGAAGHRAGPGREGLCDPHGGQRGVLAGPSRGGRGAGTQPGSHARGAHLVGADHQPAGGRDGTDDGRGEVPGPGKPVRRAPDGRCPGFGDGGRHKRHHPAVPGTQRLEGDRPHAPDRLRYPGGSGNVLPARRPGQVPVIPESGWAELEGQFLRPAPSADQQSAPQQEGGTHGSEA